MSDITSWLPAFVALSLLFFLHLSSMDARSGNVNVVLNVVLAISGSIIVILPYYFGNPEIW